MFVRILPALLFPAVAFAAPVDFARDVLPVLSDACFHCHGPDEKKREAELRLDTREGLYRTLDGVTVVTPGKPEASELVLRITSHDRDEAMPPPKANRTLKPEDVAMLKRWVAEGAPFGMHWAFQPMHRFDANGSAAPEHIDAFVRERLEKEGLALSPEADRERLIRRVSFDLTGIPPTPDEVDAFQADASPQDYERVVDRLLASPRFGERLASDWLDVARFADTNGYQMDAPRPMWQYRDWVIKAFNEKLPYDQFALWQIAGDLLPNATKKQQLATVFNRLHMQNEEGGIVGEEFRVAYVVDRVNTFATAFLGLTTECSRCHDHKFDPISQREFYSLFAFFQNIDEAGQIPYSGFVVATAEPSLLLSTAEQDSKLSEFNQRIAAKEQEFAAIREQAGAAFNEWKAAGSRTVEVQGCVGRFGFDSLEQRQIANTVDAAKPGKVQENPTLVEGRDGKAALLDGENGFTFPGLGHFTRADEFSLGLWLRAPARHVERAVVLHHTKAPVDAGSRGYELLLEDGRVSFGLHHLWPGNSIKITAREPVAPGTWTHITATYDGSSRANGMRIFVNGVPAESTVIRDALTKDITYGGEPDLAIGYRFRDSGFKDGAVDDFRVFNRQLTTIEVARVAGIERQPSQDELLDNFLATQSDPARTWHTQLHALREEQRKFIQPIPEIMAMREMPQARKAYVLKRGAYDARGDEVSADTPHVLPPFPADAPRNRLGLAKWLIDPEHPLMARVTVNRYWQMMFGRGLVETAENFGSQGAQPTHPELLDYLARDFIASGWNVKRLLKNIAMSATYRQSSKATPELVSRDPQNHLLARGPARRLDAEMLRDQALAVSGLLVERLGGPSVKPYQPPGLWEEIAMGRPKYDQSKGEGLYRRSLYTFWKRTVPPPVMTTFDAADRSNCAVRRQSTSTPLQALALLNDVQIVEAARLVARRMLRDGGATTEERVAWAFRLISDRRPSTKEIAILTRLYNEQHEIFAQDSPAAVRLIAVGETKSDASLGPADLAAGTALALALLNHDEAITRR